MIVKREFLSLGGFSNDWLVARHHFSFGHYHDPRQNGLGAISGSGMTMPSGPIRASIRTGHSEMEIITYVRDGAITHQDSLGKSRAARWQAMCR